MTCLVLFALLLGSAAQQEAYPASFERARRLQESGDVAGAVQELHRSLQEHPSFTIALYPLANAELSLGRYDEAVKHYRGFLGVHPAVYEAYCNMGAGINWIAPRCTHCTSLQRSRISGDSQRR